QPLLDRRIRQLTVDYIQNTWMLTRNRRELRQRCSQLRSEGLLPLPLRTYSLRYFLASVVTSLL
ncbi:MAG: glycosyltransferase family 2 protein, partial [Bacteroidaceae bacterium]|nr:glycosyltransferase family 2 protein [Bacteroidaceae bacterium]